MESAGTDEKNGASEGMCLIYEIMVPQYGSIRPQQRRLDSSSSSSGRCGRRGVQIEVERDDVEAVYGVGPADSRTCTMRDGVSIKGFLLLLPFSWLFFS